MLNFNLVSTILISQLFQLLNQPLSLVCQVICQKAGYQVHYKKLCSPDCDKSDWQVYVSYNVMCASCNFQPQSAKQSSHCMHQRTTFQFCTFRFHPRTDPASLRTQPATLLFHLRLDWYPAGLC